MIHVSTGISDLWSLGLMLLMIAMDVAQHIC